MTKPNLLLQALDSTPSALARAITGVATPVDETIVARRPSPEHWSVADVLNHLVDVEKRYLRRLERVVHEERPLLPSILPDETIHDMHTPLEELAGRFGQTRADTVAFLKEISPEDWGRLAVHETEGVLDLHFLVQHLADHDHEHLNQLIEIQKQLVLAPEQDTPLDPGATDEQQRGE